jgi:hypothetical protein
MTAAMAGAGHLAGCARRELARKPVGASKFGGAWPRRDWKANEAWHILSPMTAPFAAT